MSVCSCGVRRRRKVRQEEGGEDVPRSIGQT